MDSPFMHTFYSVYVMFSFRVQQGKVPSSSCFSLDFS